MSTEQTRALTRHPGRQKLAVMGTLGYLLGIAEGPPARRRREKIWAFLHLLGAFGASFCAEMVKNAQFFAPAAGWGAFGDS